MAKFTNLENAHIFSKAVVTPSGTASVSGNISAHTIQSKDIWAEKVPFITTNERETYSDDTDINKEGYAKIKYHHRKTVYNLIENNNNNVPSNGFVAKVILNEKPVEQFISATDVVDENGNIATAFNAVLYDSEGNPVPSSDYVINSSNGLIYDLKTTGNNGIFNTPLSNKTGATEYTLSFFTYEGQKIKSVIDGIDSAYKAADTIINNEISSIKGNVSNLSSKVDGIDSAYKAADSEINNEISSIKGNVSNLTSEVDGIDERLSAVEESHSLLNSTVSEHTTDDDIHVSATDRELWDKGGNMEVTGDTFITHSKTDNGWKVSLNAAESLSVDNPGTKVPTVSAVTSYVNTSIQGVKNFHTADMITFTNHTIDDDRHIKTTEGVNERNKWNSAYEKTENLVTSLDSSSNIPTSGAVKTYIDSHILDPTAYTFSNIPDTERKYYIIHDGAMNPVYVSFADELEFGISLFRHRPWKRFHIDLPNLQYTWRIFHTNSNLKSLKSAMTNMQSMVELCVGCPKLEYVDLDLSNLECTGIGIRDYTQNAEGNWIETPGYRIKGENFSASAQSSFKTSYALKSVKVAINSFKGILNFLIELNRGADGAGNYTKETGKTLSIGFYNDSKEFTNHSHENLMAGWKHTENEPDVETAFYMQKFKTELKSAHDKGWIINYNEETSQDLYDYCVANNITLN